MTNEDAVEASKNIKYYIRILFGFCCFIWMLVALDHYRSDSMMFDYEYISSNKIMRRLLSEQESYKQWNEIVKQEFSGSNLKEMDAQTSSQILEMIEHDKAAINENSEKFHKILPEYIIAKRQINIENAALTELMNKRDILQKNYMEMEESTKREQKGIETVSASGTEQTDSHKQLEKDLEDEIALMRKQLDEIKHLIHSTTTSRDQWMKKAQTLHEQLFSIKNLDKTDRGIESALNRLVHYSSNRECNWQQQQASDCSFQSDIDVGLQFDTHHFIVHNPPNYINLKTIKVSESDNIDTLCKIKVFIGINEGCTSIQQTHTTETGQTVKDNKATPREICTVSLAKSGKHEDDCSKCEGVNIDLKELEKSMLSKEKEGNRLSTFCVIMKRYYNHDTGQQPQCKGKGNVELIAATKSEKGRISCISSKESVLKIDSKQRKEERNINTGDGSSMSQYQEDRKNNKKERKQKKRKINKENGGRSDILQHKEDEQANFAWRRMVGYWPYCATLLAGIIGLGSLFIMIH